jgi:hypothetical protein
MAVIALRSRLTAAVSEALQTSNGETLHWQLSCIRRATRGSIFLFRCNGCLSCRACNQCVRRFCACTRCDHCTPGG